MGSWRTWVGGGAPRSPDAACTADCTDRRDDDTRAVSLDVAERSLFMVAAQEAADQRAALLAMVVVQVELSARINDAINARTCCRRDDGL